MTAYFGKLKDEGKLNQSFDSSAAIALIKDLSAAMITRARAGASLSELENQAIRNTELVLFEGKRSHTAQ